MDVNFPDTSNDTLLAQMMQREFDKEHDEKLKREENQFNGNSKGIAHIKGNSTISSPFNP